MEIKSRLKDKNSCDAKKYLDAYNTTKAECKGLRKENDDLAQECQLLRVENVRMKKELKRMQIIMMDRKSHHHKHSSVKSFRTTKDINNEEDDNESLNYSLVSTCSK